MKGLRESLNDKISGDVIKIKCMLGGWTISLQRAVILTLWPCVNYKSQI